VVVENELFSLYLLYKRLNGLFGIFETKASSVPETSSNEPFVYFCVCNLLR